MSGWSWAFHVDSVPFTAGVINGDESLGGSESACLGLARALAARGHDIHIFATKLDDACQGKDAWGVKWHHSSDHYAMNTFLEWDVFVALRMPHIFAQRVRARYRILWNQDLLVDDNGKNVTMALAWAYDRMAYVSAYHRHQWEGVLPEVKALGWVTKNGYDETRVPKQGTKDPNRIIHITRPERGLKPLLAMWPKLRELKPDAELHLCRYNSMYDAGGWGDICRGFDQQVEAVNARVGGITYLGELGKTALYQAIADSAVMWYPGIADFAETSCIAAIEAQACGTPFVGSWKGALPETVPSGTLIHGDAMTPAYQAKSIAAVVEMLEGCQRDRFDYHQAVARGRAHVRAYTYAAIAAEWEASIRADFQQRYESNQARVLSQCLYYDDHTAARIVAERLGDTETVAFCDKVIAGKDQGAEHYAKFALKPKDELEHEQRTQGRIFKAAEYFKGRQRVLDVACGNGTFAMLLAEMDPDVHVTGVDYSQGNIDAATEEAKARGLSDRVTFISAPFWDFDTQTQASLQSLVDILEFDGVFCGEFLEHVGNAPGLVDAIEDLAAPDALIVYTVPYGPFTALMPRNAEIHKGHVHHFCHDDLAAIFAKKYDFRAEYLSIGQTARGYPVGHWMIQYRASAQNGPAQPRNYAHRLLTLRPRQTLSVGMLAHNAEFEIGKALESIWQQADEIVIADCGSTDNTVAVVQAYDPRIAVYSIPPVQQLREGFSAARNLTLDKATGDWFLWLDTDEQVMSPLTLHSYLEGGPYRGYALRQNHVQLDAPTHYDKPVRLFKRDGTIRFYGCVHEQPQDGDCNADIIPALEATDVPIVHVGYMTEGIRRTKMSERNLPLLMRDKDIFPDRRLGKVLWVREFFNHAQLLEEQAGGLTEDAARLLVSCVQLFETEFADPADKFHDVARPFYEAALRKFGGAWEMELAIGGRFNGLHKHRVQPERIWIRTTDDFARVMDHRVQQALKTMHPRGVDCDPIGQEVTA